MVVTAVTQESCEMDSDRQGTEEEGSMGMRWMPWRRVPKKDVGSCEKQRGAADQALIR